MFVIVRRGSSPREFFRWLPPDAQGQARWEWYTRRAPAARFITVIEASATLKALGIPDSEVILEGIG